MWTLINKIIGLRSCLVLIFHLFILVQLNVDVLSAKMWISRLFSWNGPLMHLEVSMKSELI